ncbi:hypothetical protein RND71_028610 [Anisodus tanguticus]|uniref:Annexin n=1 Tax=Anisodus tanguticus TaxID=243964 RepID=A0AAE1V2S2_9SOLA|nr:hypothetical protein RND71_028610 [Anisodus tanguticus]
MCYLNQTFAGWGMDEACIIRILAHRNAAQRKLTRDDYEATYQKDLLKDLDGEISGDFQSVVHLWTMGPVERDACLANEAIKRLPGRNCIIMEISCARSSADLFKVRQTYQSRYKKSLEEDVAAHSTGDFCKFHYLLSLRYEGEEVNVELASDEAKILDEKISDKAYSDDELIRILSIRSHGFEPWNQPLILASGDMELIREKHYKRNNVTLDNAISDDTSGDYEKMLLALIGHGDL